MTVVSTEQLARRFGRRWAYAHIDLHLHSGEKVLLFGANGSGKSTLLSSLATLLPPTQGALSLFGVNPGSNLFEIRRRIGLLTHDIGLYEDLSATDNLQVFAGFYKKSLPHKKAVSLLESVGLEPRTEPICQYSAGMRKRVALALLKLKDPDLIFLDEPFSALDPEGVRVLSGFIEQSTATIVLTSHQIKLASEMCTRAVMLENGLMRWAGSSEDAWSAWTQAQEETI